MDSNFWQQLESYRKTKTLSNHKEFKRNFFQIRSVVYNKMMGSDVINNVLFFCYGGADDGHEDLVDYIIWNGKDTVKGFLNDPYVALPLAKIMSKYPGFDGNTNILQCLMDSI